MISFKKGDMVEIVGGSLSGDLRHLGDVTYVTRVTGAGNIQTADSYIYDPSNVKLLNVPQFTVGSRVRVTTDRFSSVYPKGSEATVIRTGPDNAVVVRPDNGKAEESWWRESYQTVTNFEVIPAPDLQNVKNLLSFALMDLRSHKVVQAFERVNKALDALNN